MSTDVEQVRGLGADVPASYDVADAARDLAAHVTSSDTLRAHVRGSFAHIRGFHLATRIDEQWDHLYSLCDAWDDADRIRELDEAMKPVLAQLKACGQHATELVGQANVVGAALQLAVATLVIGVVKHAVKRRVKELTESQASS